MYKNKIEKVFKCVQTLFKNDAPRKHLKFYLMDIKPERLKKILTKRPSKLVKN